MKETVRNASDWRRITLAISEFMATSNQTEEIESIKYREDLTALGPGGVNWPGYGSEDGREGVMACMVTKTVHEG